MNFFINDDNNKIYNENIKIKLKKYKNKIIALSYFINLNLSNIY